MPRRLSATWHSTTVLIVVVTIRQADGQVVLGTCAKVTVRDECFGVQLTRCVWRHEYALGHNLHFGPAERQRRHAGICAASATVSPSVISLSAFSILLLFWRADVAQWEQQVDGSLKHHQPTQQLDL